MEITPDTKEVPLFEVQKDRLIQAGSAALPQDKDDIYECVPAKNEIAIAHVKKLQRKGIWETELIRALEPVQDHPEETPCYPLMLLAVENKNDTVILLPMNRHAEKNPQGMLNIFADCWKTRKIYPREICCRDAGTFTLLNDFCEKTNVRMRYLKRWRRLPVHCSNSAQTHKKRENVNNILIKCEDIIYFGS